MKFLLQMCYWTVTNTLRYPLPVKTAEPGLLKMWSLNQKPHRPLRAC